MEQIIYQEYIVIHFNIDYMEHQIGWLMTRQKQKNGQTGGTYTYRGLQTGKEYDLRVTARDRAGNISEVKQSTNSTKTNTAPIVTDVSVSGVNSYSFTVKFKATDSEGDNFNYKLTWGPSMIEQNKQDTEYILGEDGYVYMVARDLAKITEYIFRVWAYDESDDKLFGYSDYKATKTWCDGSGQICSGFVDCNLCDGTRYM